MLDPTDESLVVVVDAHELRSAGIASLVDEWVRPLGRKAIACTPATFDERTADRNVALVIMSIGGASLYDEAVRDMTKLIEDAFLDAPIAVLSDNTGPNEAVEAANLGHQGFLSTRMSQDMARQALAFLANGGTYFPREALVQATMSFALRHSEPHRANDDERNLTPRQSEVLDGLRFGKSNKLIARELDMQESTVKVHVRQILRKLGASNRTQAALFAAARVGAQPAMRAAF